MSRTSTTATDAPIGTTILPVVVLIAVLLIVGVSVSDRDRASDSTIHRTLKKTVSNRIAGSAG